MVPALDFFDFSGYSSKHPTFEGLDEETISHIKKLNKTFSGKMKDELDRNILIEFIGLRAKAYAFENVIIYPNDTEEEVEIIKVKNLKGIQKCVVKKNIYFDHKNLVYSKG